MIVQNFEMNRYFSNENDCYQSHGIRLIETGERSQFPFTTEKRELYSRSPVHQLTVRTDPHCLNFPNVGIDESPNFHHPLLKVSIKTMHSQHIFDGFARWCSISKQAYVAKHDSRLMTIDQIGISN